MKITHTETKRTRIQLDILELDDLLIQSLRSNKKLTSVKSENENISIAYFVDDGRVDGAEIVEDLITKDKQ